MKRMISILLILCLAFTAAGMAPAWAQEEAASGPAAPEAGDTIYGFDVQEIRDYEPMGARITLFEHRKTGARVTYIANNDLNRGFMMTFMTAAPDDTGLPHIFEHATINGSEKYPSKSLFNNLQWQAYYSMMNAATDISVTIFPVMSMSEVQLLSLAGFYTDCCLHPLIMADESIFRVQGWRYEMESPDSPLTYNGVVYSEMQGSMSIRTAASFNSIKATFPGSAGGNNFAGDPDCIPELTWEEVRDFHNRYYHPGNSMTYLYGDFEDYTAFLKLLDEAFSPYERTEPGANRDSGYTRLTAPVTQRFSYPVAADADTENRSVIVYNILCPGLRENPAQERLVRHVTELLRTNSSPMMKNLKSAFPSCGFKIDFFDYAPDDSISFEVINAGEEDAELLRNTVDATFRQIAEEGFEDGLVDSVSARLRLETRLDRDYGIAMEFGADSSNSGFVIKMSDWNASSGNPFSYTEYRESLDHIPEESHEGLLAGAVRDWLTEPALWTLVTTSPEAGGKEAHDAALADKLAEIKAGMNEAELQAIVEATHAAPEEEDNSGLVRALTPLTVESLPEEIREYEISDETGEDHIRRIDVTADAEGIGRVYLFLDTRGFAQEDLPWVGLLASLLGNFGTRTHTREEILLLRDRYLMGNGFYCSLFEMSGKEVYYCPVAEWPSLDEDLEKGYELMGEILLDTRFDDVQILKDIVSAQKNDRRTKCNDYAEILQQVRLLARDNLYCAAENYLNYLGAYDFLAQVEKQLAEDPQPVIEKLTELQMSLANRRRVTAGFAGNEKSISLNRKASEALFSRLADEELENSYYQFPIPASREGIILDSNIVCNTVEASWKQLGYEYPGSWTTVCMDLLTEQLIYPALREQMGAYSAWAEASQRWILLQTYMDPNVAATFDYFETLPEQIRNLDISQEEMEPYIIYEYANMLKPRGELNGAVRKITGTIVGEDPGNLLRELRGFKEATPRHIAELADIIEKMLAEGNRSTVGNAAMIRENAELYDVILNPFGE